MHRAAFLALLLVLSSCGSGPTGRFLFTARTSYDLAPDAGIIVALTLENRAELGVGYNLCANSSLEREANGDWQNVGLFSTYGCTKELRILPPHRNSPPFPLLIDLPSVGPGLYRFRSSVNDEDESTGHSGLPYLISSNVFFLRLPAPQ